MPEQDIFDQAAATAAAASATSAPTSASAVPSSGRDIWDEAAEGYDPSPAPLKNPVKVESSTSDKILGALAPQKVPRSALSGQSQGDLPGFEGSYASDDTDKGAAISGAGVAAGTALIGASAAPKAISAAKALGSWISANPVKSYLAYEVLKDFLPKQVHDLFSAAKKVPAE